MWGGMALRVWAVRTLDTSSGPWSSFRTTSAHYDGPYRLLRHPSYAGSLLTLAGIGLALGNWLSLLLAVLRRPGRLHPADTGRRGDAAGPLR